MRNSLLVFVLALFAAACSTAPDVGAPIDDKSPATDATTGAAGTTTSGTTTSGVSGAAGTAGAAGANPLKDPKSILSKRSVYFDYDSFVIRDEFKPMLEAHARYLNGNRAARLTLQGHTDERGSREYNIALGQKRADAVKRTLTLQGVQESQIETVSFGKEKPRNLGHDEAGWAENRRVDLLYAGE